MLGDAVPGRPDVARGHRRPSVRAPASCSRSFARSRRRLPRCIATEWSTAILKPENIVLLNAETDHEQPVILDFGTAGLRSAYDELAATTLMAGSFHYMSPERLTGRYSPASDVFSFAVIILEVLTGKKLAGLKASPYDLEFCDELAATAGRIGPDASLKAAHALRWPSIRNRGGGLRMCKFGPAKSQCW